MADTRAQIVIHIGGQKCGSSALQGYLFFGRFGLEKNGISYLDPNLGTDLQNAKSHSSLLPKLRERGSDWVLERAARLQWHNPNRSYVLSSEGLCQIKSVDSFAQALAPLAAFGRVHLVFYVRQQVEVIYSGWQQWGMHLSFRDWVADALRRDFANWHRIWLAWNSAFPDAQFTTRVFALSAFPRGDVVVDFRNLLGWPEVSLPVRRAANPTFDDLTILALRALATANRIQVRPLVIAMKRAGVVLPRSRDNLVLDAEAQGKIAAHYAHDNEMFLHLSGLDERERSTFLSARIPAMMATPEGAVAAKMKEVVACLNSTPGLEEYVGLSCAS